MARTAKRRDMEVQSILAAVLDEGEQLDAIAKARGWYNSYSGAANAVKAYMARERDARTTLSALADPIDSAYTSADDSRALWEAERTARDQRQYHSPAEAERLWGLPNDFVEPGLKASDYRSTESRLWQLWFGVLHAARKTSWEDEAGQGRLVELVRQFKSRPDPPLPQGTTKALRNNWIWESGTLWSELTMLGPSARDCWNDCPNGGAGYTAVELRSWININAFVARLSVADVRDFWLYGVWACRSAFEDEPEGDERRAGERRVGAAICTAAAWLEITGQQIYEQSMANVAGSFVEVGPKTPLEELPWSNGRANHEFSRPRWFYWKARCLLLADRQALAVETRSTLGKLAELMSDLERANRE